MQQLSFKQLVKLFRLLRQPQGIEPVIASYFSSQVLLAAAQCCR
jgi:hypothetical protein